MSTQITWTGLFIFLVLPEFVSGAPFQLIGAVVMAVGIAMMWAKK